jgi:hypothetical protein
MMGLDGVETTILALIFFGTGLYSILTRQQFVERMTKMWPEYHAKGRMTKQSDSLVAIVVGACFVLAAILMVVFH